MHTGTQKTRTEHRTHIWHHATALSLACHDPLSHPLHGPLPGHQSYCPRVSPQEYTHLQWRLIRRQHRHLELCIHQLSDLAHRGTLPLSSFVWLKTTLLLLSRSPSLLVHMCRPTNPPTSTQLQRQLPLIPFSPHNHCPPRRSTWKVLARPGYGRR
jgi:hypothetical protein